MAAAPLLLLAACAQLPRGQSTPEGGTRDQWSGRLALRVDSEPVQSFFAGFELRGNAQSGELSLYSPLGSTLARMQWAPGLAQLDWNGQQRRFDSIGALTHEATGTELPIASLFAWLGGQDSQADGWSADLSQLGDGKLVAQRDQPKPAVTMRLVLD
ncbi:MAG: lipoprotein insertase outer membrane protein LolB [Burkholderiaceae bacterium]